MENMRWFEICIRSAYAFAVINYFANMKLTFTGKHLMNPTQPINDKWLLPLVIEKAQEILCEIDQLKGKPRIEKIWSGYKTIYAIFSQDEDGFTQNE